VSGFQGTWPGFYFTGRNFIMKFKLNHTFRHSALVVMFSLTAVPSLFAQGSDSAKDVAESTRYQQKLKEVTTDAAAYVARIVHKWEDAARASGKWDPTYEANLTAALMRLSPDNLLAAGDAASLEEMMQVLMTGRKAPSLSSGQLTPSLAGAVAPRDADIKPFELGDLGADLVYTPIFPCRVLDTRNIGGPITGLHSYDVDNATSFGFQGGFNGPCGVPFGVARAVVITFTATTPNNSGFLTAWGPGTQPLSSVLNWTAGWTIANTTVIPISPGGGADINLFLSASTNLIADVQGYFAAPEATALDCTNVLQPSAGFQNVAVNVLTNIDATCPTGRTATGGGYDLNETAPEYLHVYAAPHPNGNGWRTTISNQSTAVRQVRTWVRCCRVPGR